MKPTEIACFLSHKKCWEIALEEPYTAIFEDDVYLSQAARELLAGETSLPSNIGLLKLETFARPVRISRGPVHRFGGFGLHQLHGSHFGAAGYVVSRKTAAALLKLSEAPDLEPTDTFLFGQFGPVLQKHKVHQLVPAVCLQSHLMSHDGFFFTTIEYEEPIRKKLGVRAKILREAFRAYRGVIDALRTRERTTVAVPFAD
jgi:glycosyl transferase, family 25